jgi:hypothetical protein
MDFVAGKKYTQPKNISPHPFVRKLIKRHKDDMQRHKDSCL